MDNCLQYTLLDAPTDAETIAEIGYTPMPDVGPSIDQLQPMAWVDDTTTLRYGLIARGAATYFPGAVRLGEFSGQIDYGYMVPCLIKEIQSLRARVATLEGAT